jgi:TonB family protein
MNVVFRICIAIVAAAPCVAGAECEPTTPRLTYVLTPEELQKRSDTFVALCRADPAGLIDVEDDSYGDRLKGITEGKSGHTYPPDHLLTVVGKSKATTMVVVVVVETSGRGSNTSVLTSSGDPVVDAAAVAFFADIVHKQPATLDGKPVRAFYTKHVTFKRNGK